jgi:hypothetical protein
VKGEIMIKKFIKFFQKDWLYYNIYWHFKKFQKKKIKKSEEFTEFHSVDEMIKFFEQKKANRTKLQVVLDWLYYSIWCKINDIFNPRYNYNRLRRLIQRIYRGWDDSDLWSLDYTIAKKFKPYFACQEKYYPIIDALDYCIDDAKFINYSQDTYREEFEKAELMCEKGIQKFCELFFTLDNEFVHDFVCFVLPRLVEFKKTKSGCPAKFVIDDNEPFEVSVKRWDDELDLMIYAFELLRDLGTSIEKFDTRVGIGVKSFFDNFRALWS